MESAFCPPYTPEDLPDIGNRAAIVGGSVAGLCVARVLADCFQEVIIVDRDQFSEQAACRTGVPQDAHPHVIHGAARTALSRIFPSFRDDLRSAGAVPIDAMTEFDLYQGGGRLADGSRSMPMESMSRPLFESILRNRVTDVPSISIRPNCHFVDYELDPSEQDITGVVVKEEQSAEEIIQTDLVVDATGRMSRTSRWLHEHHFPTPETAEVTVDLSYSSTTIERPREDLRAVWAPVSPPRKRGGGMLPIEGNQWQVNLHGIHDTDPPTDWSAYREFASSLPVDSVEMILDEYADGTETIHNYPFTASRRFYYEKLNRFPGRLVVIGDALASFNPIYGQGISLAAVESLLLHQTLLDGGIRKIGRRFFARSQPLVSTAWRMATGTDHQYSETSGPKPFGVGVQWWFFKRLINKSHNNSELSESLTKVLMLDEKPSTLFRPRVIWRLLFG